MLSSTLSPAFLILSPYEQTLHPCTGAERWERGQLLSLGAWWQVRTRVDSDVCCFKGGFVVARVPILELHLPWPPLKKNTSLKETSTPDIPSLTPALPSLFGHSVFGAGGWWTLLCADLPNVGLTSKDQNSSPVLGGWTFESRCFLTNAPHMWTFSFRWCFPSSSTHHSWNKPGNRGNNYVSSGRWVACLQDGHFPLPRCVKIWPLVLDSFLDTKPNFVQSALQISEKQQWHDPTL